MFMSGNEYLGIIISRDIWNILVGNCLSFGGLNNNAAKKMRTCFTYWNVVS